MNPNPRLVIRFNNRHYAKNRSLVGKECKYFPYVISENDDLKVGQLVKINKEPEGPAPDTKIEKDLRPVEVVKVDWCNTKVTVFMNDLSPR